MNNKLKKLIFVFFILLFVIFLLNIYTKRIETIKPDITNMNILNYIPNDYEFTILSNTTNNNIKQYINKNISVKKREELNIIKDSIISYLGFDLNEKIENIYDNELALSFFKNKLNYNDILLIFRIKQNKNINDIININEELNKYDQIIELNRPGKLNYINHIFQTSDNYIIASSNKELIENSIQLNNNTNTNTKRILTKDLIPDGLNFKKVRLLSISKYINPINYSNIDRQTKNKLITIINSEDGQIKLRSFSQNLNKINTKIINNKIDNIKNLIVTNKYSISKRNKNFLFNDIKQKEFLEEISQEVNEQLLLITNNNNWVLCFKNEFPNKVSVDKFNHLKNYKKEDLYIDNINYSIYTNERLKIKDNNIIYEKENSIFSLKNEEYTYISNNFDALLNIANKTTIPLQYLNKNSEIKPHKFIVNDIYFINYLNNKQIVQYYKSLKNIQNFINTELFSLEDINIHITHAIPERNENVYLESNLKIL